MGSSIKARALSILVLLMVSTIPILVTSASGDRGRQATDPWDFTEVAHGQYLQTPMAVATPALHGANGGPGNGPPAEAAMLATISEPTLNWNIDEGGDGASNYGVAVANLSTNIVRPPGALERCGQGALFAAMTVMDGTTADLVIVAGDSGKIAWEVSLGTSLDVRTTPMILDIDGDGSYEVIVVHETNTDLKVSAWSPDLTCSESGWTISGHDNERLWEWSDGDLRISTTLPYWATGNGGQRAVTQPLLADLGQDGVPDLVLATLDTSDGDDPTVIALPLASTAPTDPSWSVVLDRGTHPSDPAWGALDAGTDVVILTTLDENSGNMWAWRIDGATGSLDWDRVAIEGTDADSNAPRLRLPGPVIAQFDDDASPEVVLTLPSDSNGRTSGNGAQFAIWELTSTTEILRFRTPNGFADAPPVPDDRDGDGIMDRLCWATWYSTSAVNLNRQGLAGCHDLDEDEATKAWSQTMEQGSGNSNDEIALAPGTLLDLDGEDELDLVVPFGRRLYAFDGSTGASADLGSGWDVPLNLPQRSWAAPVAQDLDGDGTLDVLVGGMLISEASPDIAPLLDGRGISFTPSDPDPGSTVTITGSFANYGTVTPEVPVDVRLVRDGVTLAHHRVDTLDPVAPSGEGGPVTFSTTMTATLGSHRIDLIIDPDGNISQSRIDNDLTSAVLDVLEPYAAQLRLPSTAPRIEPGTTGTIEVMLDSTGRRGGTWVVSVSEDGIPEGWSLVSMPTGPIAIEAGGSEALVFSVAVPANALGDAFVDLPLTITSVEDGNVTVNGVMRVEALRTRGLNIIGPSGGSMSDGHGRPGHDAHAWISIENLGNAPESTTSIEWTGNPWGAASSPALIDPTDGSEVFAMTLQPYEIRILHATVLVPEGTAIGERVSNRLTICIGSSEDRTCGNITVSTIATDVTASPPHAPVLPTIQANWTIQTEATNGGRTWNLSGAGMLRSGWSWSAGGDLMLESGMLRCALDTACVGWIAVDLPETEPSARHGFEAVDALGGGVLNLSLHVLQIFRAELEVVQPLTDGPPVEPGTSIPVVLRLSNPGNGIDTYRLTAQAIGNDSQRTLIEHVTTDLSISAGAVLLVTAQVTLPEDLAAGTITELRFIMTGQSGITSTALLNLTTAPTVAWQADILGTSFRSGPPGSNVNWSMRITNQGNADDAVMIQMIPVVTPAPGDTTIWPTLVLNTSLLDQNTSEVLDLSIRIPDGAWNLSQVAYTITASNEGWMEPVANVSVGVERISGWIFDATNASLVVPPEGGNVTFSVLNEGNAGASAYFARGTTDWNLSSVNSTRLLDPGEHQTVTIHVTPPEGALAGSTAALPIFVSDGDGRGQSTLSLPVRVGVSHGMELAHHGDWLIHASGGYAATWIENTGNGWARVDIDVTGLPPGWQKEGGGTTWIPPRSVTGVGLNLIPPATWDRASWVANVQVVTEANGTLETNLRVTHSDVAWGSSPVHSGLEGDMIAVPILGTGTGASINLTLGTSTERSEHVLSTGDGSILMPYHLVARALPDHRVRCTASTVESLSPWISCEMTSGDEPVDITTVILDATGRLLSQNVVTLDRGTTLTLNLSEPGGLPTGIHSLTISAYDGYGRQLTTLDHDAIVRPGPWNVGIGSITESGDDLVISITRTNADVLEGTPCSLQLRRGSTVLDERSIFLDGPQAASLVGLRMPSDDGNRRLTVALRCPMPFEVDDDPDDDERTHQLAVTDGLSSDATEVAVTGVIAALTFAVGYLIITRSSREDDGYVDDLDPPEVSETPFDDSPAPTESEPDHEPAPQELEEESDEIEEEIQSEPLVLDDAPNEASRRLADLRREMKGEAEDTTMDVSDRMERFFNQR